MRIALIASSLRLAGAEKQFVYVARALLAAGIDVRVFYLGPGDHYQRALVEEGISLHQIFQRDRPLLMLARLTKELSRFKPHIVLASQFGDLVFAAPAGRACRALVLGGVRSDGFYELNTNRRRSWFMLQLTHGLIANSNRARENLVSMGIKPLKIAVLPNVIDLEDFDHQGELPFSSSIPLARPVVAAVGSLHPCKRFDRFLEALAVAKSQEPNVFGVVAGKDLGAGPALEQKARTLGLGPRDLAFLGESDRIPALLRRCRLLVLCSDYEGFPNVILEAMAASLPVVTTPAGDAGFIVKDHETGYIVRNDDVHDMAARIVELVQDPELCAQLGSMGRKRLEQEYDFALLPNRILSILTGFARQQRRGSLLKVMEEISRRPNQRTEEAGRLAPGPRGFSCQERRSRSDARRAGCAAAIPSTNARFS